MAGLAGLAIQKGYKVTGQDKAYYPPMSTQLTSLGIKVNQTEDIIDDLDKCDAVIIGNSLSRGNKTVEYILDKGIEHYSGPEWIKNHILKSKYVFVVSGTHGKTTTTSMLIKILQESGKNPSYLVGGIYKDNDISYKYTSSDYFIIEGDEYDTSFFDKRSKFIHYKPDVLIINNLEYDHSDIFENIDQIKKQFHFLIRTMSKNKNIIYDHEDFHTLSLLSMGCWCKKIPYKKIKNINNVIGDHNLKNASAAIAAAEIIGIKKNDSILALENFSGVKRRLELITNKNFILYDDFAHHPTAISASIEAIKTKHPGKKIFVFFEIRSNSMISGAHKNKLIDSFSEAEEVFIYCKNNISWFHDSIKCKIYKDLDTLSRKIIANIENVDIVILMSNGDTSCMIKKLNQL